MKYLLLLVAVAGAIVYISGDCQPELDKLNTDYKNAQAKAGADVCDVTNTYVSQYWILMESPNCTAAQQGSIKKEKDRLEALLKTNYTSCVLCIDGVTKCFDDYQTAQKAAQDQDTKCKNGEKTVKCLTAMDTKVVCTHEKNRVQNYTMEAQKELNACSGAERLQTALAFVLPMMMAVIAMLK